MSWYRDLLGEEVSGRARAAGLSPDAYLDAGAEQVPPGCDGLLAVLDWLAPADAPFRRGSLLGFDGRQGRFHIHRAILEALALTVQDASARMAAELGTEYREVIVSGGGSRSDLMMQIHADVHGLPARRAEASSGAAGLGAAICAAVGVGLCTDFDEAVDRMVRPGAVFVPDGARRAVYRRLGEVHREVRRHTDEIYRQTYGVLG